MNYRIRKLSITNLFSSYGIRLILGYLFGVTIRFIVKEYLNQKYSLNFVEFVSFEYHNYYCFVIFLVIAICYFVFISVGKSFRDAPFNMNYLCLLKR